jgi:hypothetical protein
MEERLTQIGNWLRRSGEAIYGARPRSAGSISKLEKKELRAGSGIRKILDSPPTGYVRAEAVPTSKSERYAIVQRRPMADFLIDRPPASVSLCLKAGPWTRPELQRSKLTLRIPKRLSASCLAGEVSICKIAGAR